jgi:hypothetical protein
MNATTTSSMGSFAPTTNAKILTAASLLRDVPVKPDQTTKD